LKAADIGISVDNAVDVAKNAASVVLLDKDLAVLAGGIILGRKTFVNTMKYVRVGISAAFGNVLSMAIAALFLPYLPMLPLQILLLNFLTDFPAIMIAGDAVDSEVLEKPRAWDIKNIRKLMIVFGLVSTAFDLATFALLRFIYDADEKLFHSAWFVESALTEIAVMMVLRTHRRFWKSRPGTGLFIASAIITVIIVALPFTAVGTTLGFVALPATLLMSIFAMIALYIVVNEAMKNRWWR
jgi:Mg2+-importing ATPase